MAIGYDPVVPEMPPIPQTRAVSSDFNFGYFAMSFYLTRGLWKHTREKAGGVIGVRASTIKSLEQGDEMPIGVVLRACAYMQRHPFKFLECSQDDVSRETPHVEIR